MKRSLGTAMACVILGTALAGYMPPARSWSNPECRFDATRIIEADAHGAEAVLITAGAKHLVVRGHKGATSVHVEGRACAPSESALEKISIRADKDGNAIRIEPEIPHLKNGVGALLKLAGRFLDITVDVPADLPVSLQNTSGRTEIMDIDGGKIVDGAGELTIRNVSGGLDVVDGSGDLHIGGVGGNLTLRNGSGDILITDVKGDVLIAEDGSGDITILRSGGNVKIMDDTSGEVTVAGVAGNFDLGKKGSGTVHTSDVHGQIRIPDNKR